MVDEELPSDEKAKKPQNKWITCIKQWGYIIVDSILISIFILSGTINHLRGNLQVEAIHFSVVIALAVKIYFDVRKVEKVTGYAKKEKRGKDKSRNSADDVSKRKRRCKRN